MKASDITKRQEEFCRRVAQGASQAAAYLGAGYRGDKRAARNSASRLAKVPKIKARIVELKEILGDQKGVAEVGWRREKKAISRAIERIALSKEYVLNGLTEIAERCMRQSAVDGVCRESYSDISSMGLSGRKCGRASTWCLLTAISR